MADMNMFSAIGAKPNGGGMDPATIAMVGSTALNAAGSLVGGSNQPKEQTSWYVAPEQAALLRQLILQQYSGGDAGLGADLKSGNATLAAMMAGRGIAPTSGVYNSAMAGMAGKAIAGAAQNRFQNLYNLISASPAMVTGKIGNPDVEGYSWTPTGIQERKAWTSNWGTPDATWNGAENINAVPKATEEMARNRVRRQFGGY